MLPLRLALAMLALALAACGMEPQAPRDADEPTNSAGDAPRPAAATQPPPSAQPVAPSRATSPTELAAAPAPHQARFDGFGPLRLGMEAAEAEAAWPGLFSRTHDAMARRDCHHVAIDLPYFALMFDDGRFVRYGGGNDALIAPGGGRRGMAEAELRALYHGALQEAPDRYARGGKLLSIQASGVAPSKLVFVLRPDGVVNEWHVGLLPQADYHEGCESDA